MRTNRWVDQRVAVCVVYVAALFMNILDTTIVNVALPTLGRQFHVPATSVDVVVIGYLVSLAVFIPASGWIGDRFGPRRVLLIAIFIFTVASALCSMATSLDELIVFRVLQGVGGGMLTPVGMAMLFRTFPPAERIRAASILTIPTAFAPAIGPVLGGFLVDNLSWRWVFLVNLPIGVAALTFGTLFLKERRETNPGPFDLRGFLLSGLGFASVMYGLSYGPIRGWRTPSVLGTIALGAVLLALMLRVERRVIQPMVDLALFKDRMFRISNQLMVLTLIGFFGLLYMVPVFYQDGLGLSALGSGLATFPEAVGVLVGAQLVSRLLYARVGPRRLILWGLLALGCSIAPMALVGAHTNLWWMRLLMFAAGYSIAHVFVPMNAAAFATIDPASTGRASTLFNAQRQLGSALGVALLSSVAIGVGLVTRHGEHVVPNLAAYHTTFLVASGLTFLAAALATRVRDSDAAATMTARTRTDHRRSAPAEERLAVVPVPGGTGKATPELAGAGGARSAAPR
jgi:EmrB/QacA subfamily drug resistance transporter